MASLYRRPYLLWPNASQSPSHHADALQCRPILAPSACHDSNGSSGSNCIDVTDEGTARRAWGGGGPAAEKPFPVARTREGSRSARRSTDSIVPLGRSRIGPDD